MANILYYFKNKLTIIFILSNLFYLLSFFMVGYCYYILSWDQESVDLAFPRVGNYLVNLGSTSPVITYFLLLFWIVQMYLYSVYAKGLKETIYYSLTFLFIYLFLEIILRVFVVQPGSAYNDRNFKMVKSLIEFDGYITDENGITKIHPEVVKHVNNEINKNSLFNHLVFRLFNKTKRTDAFEISPSYILFKRGSVKSNLYQVYSNLDNDNNFSEELIYAIKEYVNNPLNDDGFRSVAFKKIQSKKPSILLLGDSFTWGHTASNLTNSFADELLAKGYVVYNSGITSTDVAQYLAIAQKYVPLLKPDFVIVNFYLGNDIIHFKREPLPYQPVFFATNAGNLLNAPHGMYFLSKDSIYNFLTAQMEIPKEESLANLMLAQTSTTTLLWRFLYHFNVLPQIIKNDTRQVVFEEYYNDVNKNRYEQPYSNQELKMIQQICLEHNSKFILSSIPEVNSKKIITASNYNNIFEGLDYAELIVEKNMYNLKDGHFNDLGHKRYAEFLDSLLNSN